MIKNKNTNNKVCVLSDTDRKAVKVMSKENNNNKLVTDDVKDFAKYLKVKEEKGKYREVINLCKELQNKIEKLDEDDLLIESTFTNQTFLNDDNPIEDIKLHPRKIQYTIEAIANFHHLINKSLIDRNAPIFQKVRFSKYA